MIFETAVFGLAVSTGRECSGARPVNIQRSFTLERFVRDRDVKSEKE